MATVTESPTDQVREDARLARVRWLLALSFASVVAAELLGAVTDLGGFRTSVGVLLSAVLLWLVYRRNSRIARGVAFIPAATWAVAFAVGTWMEPDVRAAAETGLVAILFAGQAVPLVMPAVRDHVQLHRPVLRSHRLAFERGRLVEPPLERDDRRRP